MSHYYDRQGNEIDAIEWGKLFGDLSYKTVARTERGDILISTVWLGLDHNWGDGPPLIFETMIFGGPEDEWCQRYPTEAEALEGHETAVRMVFHVTPEEMEEAAMATSALLERMLHDQSNSRSSDQVSDPSNNS